ncbi:hypothetical protein PMIN06_011704 [Paraphaeosphaeria minitans]
MPKLMWTEGCDMPAPVSKITKDTITVKGIDGLTLGPKRDAKALLKGKSKIWFWTGCDKKQKLFEKLSCEWNLAPMVNTHLKEDISGLLDKSNRIVMICITGFFDEGADFVFFVKGYKNLVGDSKTGLHTFSDCANDALQANFLKLTFSGQAYNDPCFATPLQAFTFKKLIESPGLDCLALECVGKTETKGLRWLYLYKSAVNAWNKLEFDDRKYMAIKERLERPGPMVEALSDTEEDTPSDTTDEDDDGDDDEDDDEVDDEDDDEDDDWNAFHAEEKQ